MFSFFLAEPLFQSPGLWKQGRRETLNIKVNNSMVVFTTDPVLLSTEGHNCISTSNELAASLTWGAVPQCVVIIETEKTHLLKMSFSGKNSAGILFSSLSSFFK